MEKKKMMHNKNQHPAEIYNSIRRIVFSIYHRDGYDHAKEILEKNRSKLNVQSMVGLKAELSFYHRFQKEYCLTPALDSGEHVDFAGNIGIRPVRFDVTTNEKFKEFKNYEKFLCEGYDYRIAIMDGKNWEIKDVIDLAFPKCPSCGNGNLFSIAVLLGENFNHKGESQWTHDQLLLDVCPYCEEFRERDSTTTHFLPKISDYAQEVDHEDLLEDDYKRIVEGHTHNAFDYLRKLWEIKTIKLMGLADSTYFTTSKDGDGYWGIKFQLLQDVVRNRFPDHIQTGMLENTSEEW
ncbi:MAG TPA: hypothetical protein PKH10_10760 [bacterium]|nr:hypothetical protein [bacterium]